MKIYIGHSTDYDFKNELYKPLIKSKLNKKHTLVLPHEKSSKLFNSKDFLKNKAELMIAEVSNKSLGVGIELGWANLNNVKIICIYKKDTQLSSSLKAISNNFIEYSNSIDLIEKLEKILLND